MPRIRQDWLVAGALAVVTFATFFSALQGEFVNFDDYTYVSRNPYVTNGITIDGLRWAFTTSCAANWHPLTWLSLQLDSDLWHSSPGRPDPRGYHLTSILLHSINVALLFQTLRALTGAFWRSAAVALLFAVHPLRVESVAWIAERKDVLSAFFGLIALRAYVAYVRQPTVGRYLPVAVALALSLMSKPMLVTLPCLLLVLDWWPLDRVREMRDWRRLVFEKLPLFALVLVSSVITYLVQAQEGAVMALEDSPPLARVTNALISYVVYLGKMVWPLKLAAFYPHPGAALRAPETIGAVLLIVTFTAAALLLRRRSPYLLAGWLWYLGTLVPVIGLVQVGNQALADRYTYFPQIGMLLAVCWGVAELTRGHTRIAFAMLAVAATACIATTSIQIGYWKNSLTLWNHALAVSGDNATTMGNLGETLEHEGRLDEAAEYDRKAVELAPKSVQARVNLGTVLQKQNRLDEAAEVFADISRIAPESPAGYTNLGLLYLRRKDFDAAARQFDKACQNAPPAEKGGVYRNRGMLEDDRGNLAAAEEFYRESLKWDPKSPHGHAALGSVLLRLGKSEEGLDHLRQAVRLDPNFEQGHTLLGKALAARGEFEVATQHLTKAVELNPDQAMPWYNLGVLYGRQGRIVEEAECLTRAVERAPDVAAFRRALDGAVQHLRSAGREDVIVQIDSRLRGLKRSQSVIPSSGRGP
jgi:tetratricopeptide (TPR) repeat protein